VVRSYPDAYVGMHKGSKSVSNASRDVGVPLQEEVTVRADKYLEDIVPIVPYVSETVTKKRIDQVGDASVKIVRTVIDDERTKSEYVPTSSSSRGSEPGMSLLVIAGMLFVFLLAFMVWSWKKKRKNKVSLQDFSSREIPDIPQFKKS